MDMLQTKHFKVVARDDDEAYKNGSYEDLFGYSQEPLNKKLQDLHDEGYRGYHIVSVNELFSVDEIRPVQCNSGTWYERQTLALSVWMEKGVL